jgi:hypothetical protein
VWEVEVEIETIATRGAAFVFVQPRGGSAKVVGLVW